MKMPEGWQEAKIQDIALVDSGQGAPQGDEWYAGNEIFVKANDLNFLSEGKYVGDYCKGINNDAIVKYKLKKYPANSIVFPKSGMSVKTDNIALLKYDAYVVNHLAIIQPVNKDEYLAKYLYYLLKKIRISKLSLNESYPSIRLNDVKKYKIALPPRSCIKKIVETLEKAKQLKEWRKESDKLTDDYLNSVFLEMFGDPGKNIDNFPVEKLENICTKITDGEHNIPPRIDKGKPLLMAKNVRDGYIDFDDISYISEEDHRRSWKRCNPEEGDVLLICVGATIGRLAIVPKFDEFSLVRSVALLKPDYNKITSQYLLWCLKSKYIQSKFLSRRNTSAQAGLYLKEIKKIEIPSPPLPLQNEFSKEIEKYNRIKKYQIKSKIQINDLFNALMQKAFRGELVC